MSVKLISHKKTFFCPPCFPISPFIPSFPSTHPLIRILSSITTLILFLPRKESLFSFHNTVSQKKALQKFLLSRGYQPFFQVKRTFSPAKANICHTHGVFTCLDPTPQRGCPWIFHQGRNFSVGSWRVAAKPSSCSG